MSTFNKQRQPLERSWLSQEATREHPFQHYAFLCIQIRGRGCGGWASEIVIVFSWHFRPELNIFWRNGYGYLRQSSLKRNSRRSVLSSKQECVFQGGVPLLEVY